MRTQEDIIDMSKDARMDALAELNDDIRAIGSTARRINALRNVFIVENPLSDDSPTWLIDKVKVAMDDEAMAWLARFDDYVADMNGHNAVHVGDCDSPMCDALAIIIEPMDTFNVLMEDATDSENDARIRAGELARDLMNIHDRLFN